MGIRGIGEACRALDVPITGGNVSLYNETDGQAIYPTPVLGVVGLIEDAAKVLRRGFRRKGSRVLLLGATHADVGGSEYLKVIHGRVAGRPPKLDLDAEKRLYALMAEAAAAELLESAHDLSDGGLAVALAECCFAGEEAGVGGTFDVSVGSLPAHVALFSETPSRMLVEARDASAVRALAERHDVPVAEIGTVGGDRLAIRASGKPALDVEIARLHEAWMSLEKLLSR
jgi:phosphoribosylformylglycinamidine synthase